MTKIDSLCFIEYDSWMQSDKDFADDLQAALMSVVKTEQVDDAGHIHYSPTAIEWLEIAFVFAGTTIATGMLTKIGEDIWDKLKSAATSANKRLRDRKERFKTQGLGDATKMQVTITVKTDRFILSGSTEVGNYEEVIKLLKQSRLMIDDANVRLARGAKAIKKDKKYRAEKNAVRGSRVFQYGLWLDYEYDLDSESWELEQITNYKKSRGSDYIEV